MIIWKNIKLKLSGRLVDICKFISEFVGTMTHYSLKSPSKYEHGKLTTEPSKYSKIQIRFSRIIIYSAINSVLGCDNFNKCKISRRWSFKVIRCWKTCHYVIMTESEATWNSMKRGANILASLLLIGRKWSFTLNTMYFMLSCVFIYI